MFALKIMKIKECLRKCKANEETRIEMSLTIRKWCQRYCL